MRISEKDLSRFVDKIDFGDGNGCWLWAAGQRNREDGYGSFLFQGRMRQAHQVAYLIWNGPIADGMLVRHDCDTRLCVKPSHLRLGTNDDNQHDKKVRGRGGNGGRTGVLASYVPYIMREIARGRSRRSLARELGVTSRAVDYWGRVHTTSRLPEAA